MRRLRDRPLPAWATDIGATSWAQVLLKFVLSHPAVTCAIPATSSVAHVRENMGAAMGRLPDEPLRRRLVAHEFGDGERPVEHRVESGEGLAGWAIEHRRPLRLAPSYDMLPMLYAPQRGEVRDPPFEPRSPLTRALEQGRAAQPVAVQFWQRLAADVRVTAAFRAIASANAERVAALRL